MRLHSMQLVAHLMCQRKNNGRPRPTWRKPYRGPLYRSMGQIAHVPIFFGWTPSPSGAPPRGPNKNPPDVKMGLNNWNRDADFRAFLLPGAAPAVRFASLAPALTLFAQRTARKSTFPDAFKCHYPVGQWLRDHEEDNHTSICNNMIMHFTFAHHHAKFNFGFHPMQLVQTSPNRQIR